MKLQVRHRGFWLLAALIVAGIAGVVAYASIPDRHGVIHGCYKKSNGQLRVINLDVSHCRPSEKAISWNQRGPQGPPGISGYEEKTHQVFVSAGAFANVSVACSAGKKVFGGGFDIETPEDVKIFSSEPSDGSGNVIDNGWNVFVHNAGSVTRQVTVIAVCALAQ
jgi:hypothetical protein